MVFACQKDSYSKSFKTKVKSCQKATCKQVLKGKNVEQEGFDVILEDTILFPEGGGQPSDKGKINDKQVLNVSRKGTEAVHFTTEEFQVGEEVIVEVDWTRRWDHMQQHSGQHLISALATSLYNFNTTAWNLGDKSSFIELDTKEMTQDQIDELESECNRFIKASTSVKVEVYPDQHHPKVKELHSRGFPEDMGSSEVRVICIDGVDENPCCGTHVSNLSHLQAIKLLGVEKGKKNKTNLLFLVGDRLLKTVGQAFQKDKDFTSILKGHPDEHVELLKKMQASLKLQQKSNLTLLRELAMLESERLNREKPKFHSVHKKEGDQDFINVLISNAPKETLLFITTGDEKTSGSFALSGPEDLVKSAGELTMKLMEGKGAFKSGRYQGKVNKMSGKSDVENEIQKVLEVA